MAYYDDIYEIAADNYGIFTRADAQSMGISDKELSRITASGRLVRLGHGVYRVKHHIPEKNSPYAESVAIVGEGAYLYGESVIAMHELAPTNPADIYVGCPRRIRRNLPTGLTVIHTHSDHLTTYQGIPSHTIPEAIRACAQTMMRSRLIEAVRVARNKGLINATEERELLEDLNGRTS
ncbi:hypothetical protein HLV35_06895 [Eggerthellaceae bacterium zg-997]|nr:hypothetical protein [Eggerthellaceae bacterium zg-997]